MSTRHEPKGVRFFDAASGRHMVLIDEQGREFDQWICYRHPDGYWVSLRRATEDDLKRIATELEAKLRADGCSLVEDRGDFALVHPAGYGGTGLRAHDLQAKTRDEALREAWAFLQPVRSL